MQHIVNAQGLNMPKLGLGTWPMLAEECRCISMTPIVH
jgi:2,5-diketo-D-gluconate reductase B